jgi:hypothetical protein
MNRITRPRFSIPMSTINKFARLMPEPSRALKLDRSVYGLYLIGDPTRTIYRIFSTEHSLVLFIDEQLPEAFRNSF